MIQHIAQLNKALDITYDTSSVRYAYPLFAWGWLVVRNSASQLPQWLDETVRRPVHTQVFTVLLQRGHQPREGDVGVSLLSLSRFMCCVPQASVARTSFVPMAVIRCTAVGSRAAPSPVRQSALARLPQPTGAGQARHDHQAAPSPSLPQYRSHHRSHYVCPHDQAPLRRAAPTTHQTRKFRLAQRAAPSPVRQSALAQLPQPTGAGQARLTWSRWVPCACMRTHNTVTHTTA